MGFVYYNLKKYDSAIQFINQGLSICGIDCSNKVLVLGKNGLGLANLGLKKYSTAENYLLESLKLAEVGGLKRIQIHNIASLARLKFAMKENEVALTFLHEADSLLRDVGFIALKIDILSQFSDYYFFHNLFQKAALYQKQYITLKDSLMGNEFTQNMAAIQSEYEQRAHQAAIAQKDALLQQERYLVYAVGFIALLIIVVIFILIRIYLLKLNHVQQKKLGMVEVQATERER
jgi:hypothetical protein